jgi:CheY-like chemotaxis protein
VTDTGGGISEEVLAHVFEPYFTTKETGKGTGLGLSMAQGMAAQFGGKATIESRVGDGTSVNIILSRAPAPAAHVQSAEGMPAATGSGRILVVDDDAGVRSFLTDALVDLGYEAIVASDFADALSIVQGGEPLDAVLSDFKMPGMSGSDLLARLQEIRPGLKGLLITGNTEAVDKRDVSFPVLGKPFKLAVLADHLRTLLTPAEQGRRL